MGFYQKYRPKKFKEIIGQIGAVTVLDSMLKENRLPHCILFTGPSGCGKTTIARILKSKLKCGNADFHEINAAESRGIDTIREIDSRLGSCPMSGTCKIYLLDESGKLSGDAQTCLLKILEDTPKHVYFFLATTDPNKLIKTIRTRCTEVHLQPLIPKQLEELVKEIANKEGKTITETVAEKIGIVADGSARKAVVILEQIISLPDEKSQLEVIESCDSVKLTKTLVKVLLQKESKWQDIVSVIKQTEEEPETLRRMILGYVSAILLNGKFDQRAVMILEAFEGDFFASGKAGLIRACAEVHRQ